MSEAHSLYSASGFEAAQLCPGKVVLEKGKPNRSSIHAATGTHAHAVLELCVREGSKASTLHMWQDDVDGFSVTADQDMVDAVQTALDVIAELAGPDGMVQSEQRVNYAAYLDVPEHEAWGTSDVIIIRGSELIIADYKHGMGVEVDARDNPQMMLYALGALNAVGDLFGPFETVRMVILQPRIKAAPSEWVIPVAELEAWAATARSAVRTRLNAIALYKPGDKSWQDTFLRPGEKQCKFCRAKAECPALRDEVSSTVFDETAASPDDFAPLTVYAPGAESPAAWLGAVYPKLDLIADWCKAVLAEIERRNLAGDTVPGTKLVQGKRGNRAWSDAEAAEKLLRETFRLKVEEAYDLKLISPTSAEKLHKAGTIGPRQWPKAVALITQAEGKPHVAPASDPRPALDIRPVAEDFTDLGELA